MGMNLLTKYKTQMYDTVFITNIPAFYKINLYNEINKKKKIFVIFISQKSFNRTDDFYKGEKFFDYIILNEEFYEARNQLKSIIKLSRYLKNIKFKSIVIGGWDSIENWYCNLFCIGKEKGVVVESSEFESEKNGIKGFLKKIFLYNTDVAFVSGESQKKLLNDLGYKNKVVITNGVGIFNYNKLEKNLIDNIKKVEKFLYVGRLAEEKNIEQLIRVFNNLPSLKLSIVGYGPLEKKLKDMAKQNIIFLGEIENKRLGEIYKENHVFILPSIVEPWGLVVEEAIANGLPVILSNKIGCKNVILNMSLGFEYNVNSDEELKEKINQILNLEKYLELKTNIDKVDLIKIKEKQIIAYI